MKVNARRREAGFGLIGILVLIFLILILVSFKTDFFNSTKQKAGYVQQQAAAKQHVEARVRDIKKLAQQRYG